MIKKMFAPQAVTPRFDREFPVGLTLRPSQIRPSPRMPRTWSRPQKPCRRGTATLLSATILAGDADEIVDFESQALRLHKECPAARLDVFMARGT